MAKGKQEFMHFRIEPGVKEAFERAIGREAELFGFEERTSAVVARELMREYVKRIESIEQSSTAKMAAKTMRKAVRQ